MRVYDICTLKECSKIELEKKLKMVQCNDDLTIKEKDANVDIIKFVLNGCVHNRRDDVLEDIKNGSADIDDIGLY